MNEELKTFLQSVFNLTEKEFNENLAKEEISSWDSLKHMDLVTGIEKKYQLTLEMQDILEMQSIPDILRILEKKGINLGT